MHKKYNITALTNIPGLRILVRTVQSVNFFKLYLFDFRAIHTAVQSLLKIRGSWHENIAFILLQLYYHLLNVFIARNINKSKYLSLAHKALSLRLVGFLTLFSNLFDKV